MNAFTQEAWDSQVKPLIDERAKDLAEMFKELGLDNKGVDSLVAGLRDLHKKRHELEWKRFLSSIHPRQRDFRAMTDARDALRRLSGEVSPYRKLFRNAWQKRALNMGPSERQGEVSEQEQKALEESSRHWTNCARPWTTS